jgi:predicted ATPase
VLLWENQVQPLLLVCEDLHWIDSEMQALLDRLIESLPTAHLLRFCRKFSFEVICGMISLYDQR